MMRSFTFFVFIFLNTFLSSQKVGFDSTYGENGVFSHKISDNEKAISSMTLPDGKIVVSTNKGLVRFNTDCTLDTSFGNNGIKTDGIYINKFYSQSDGKILGIYYDNKEKKIIIYRFLTDLTLDSSYGINGKLNLAFNGGEINAEHAFIYMDNIFLTDGAKIIKISNTGVLEMSFADNGVLPISYTSTLSSGIVPINEKITSSELTILPNGQIVVGGTKKITVEVKGIQKFVYEGFLIKYDTNGAIVNSFGNNSGVEIFRQTTPEIIFEEAIPSVSRLYSNSEGDFYAILGGYQTNTWFSQVRKYSSEGDLVNEGVADEFDFNIKNIQKLSDGRFLFAGNVFNSNSFCLYIVDANGNMNSYVREGVPNDHNATFAGLTIDDNGNVLVIGDLVDFKNNNITFFKYANTGKPMKPILTFGTKGKLAFSFDNNKMKGVYYIAIQPDNKLLLLNKRECSLCNPSMNPYIIPYPSTINRLTKEGTIDDTFTTSVWDQHKNLVVNKTDGSFKGVGVHDVMNFTQDGVFTHADEAVYKNLNAGPQGVAIQPDGKYYYIHKTPFEQVFNISRNNPDGSKDESYAPYNFIKSNSDRVDYIALQPDGKLVIKGYFSPGYEYPEGKVVELLRLNADGSKDTTFNCQGLNLVGNIAIQSDGKILVVYKNKISRFLSNGDIDNSYGTNGILSVDFLGEGNYILQTDDKILINTRTSSGVNELIRFNTDGSIDTSFANNGKYTFDSSFNLTSLAEQSDKKILLAGTKDNGEYTAVVRLMDLSKEPLKTSLDLSTGKKADGSLQSTNSEPDTNWYYTRPDGSGQHPVTRSTYTGWGNAQVGPTQNSVWITGENDPQSGYFEYTSKQFVIPEKAENATLTLRALSFARDWVYLVKENEDGTTIEEEITRTQWISGKTIGWLNSRNPLVEKELLPGKYHIKVKVYTLNGQVRQSLDVNANVYYELKNSPSSKLSIASDKDQALPQESITFSYESTHKPTAYFWEFTDGLKILTSTEAEPVVNFAVLGDHKVKLVVSYSDGTNSVAEKQITVQDSTLEIEDTKEQKSTTVQISPNPTTGIFKIVGKENTKLKVHVLDITGKVLVTKDFGGIQEKQIDIHHLPAGVYIVKIETDRQTEVRKLIKK